ncbi:MAG: hypothetical protein ACLFR5_01975 [Halobacteriales archaeon]
MIITRRGLLRGAAGASVVALAGCVDPRAVLTLEEVDDAELADRVAEDVEGTDGEDAVRRAVENGTYTTGGDSSGLEPPIEAGEVVYEDVYYDLSVEATTVAEDRLYVLRVENVGSGSVNDEVAYDELPEADRNALLEVFEEEDATDEGFEDGTEYPYTEDEHADSVLVDGATVVRDGLRYEVEAEQRRTIERQEFTYTADEIADSAEDFGGWARDKYGFTLDGLSDEERSVVEDAIDGGYYEGSTTDAFESLVRRFREHRAVTSDEFGGEWIVEYEGATYFANVSHPSSLVEDG